jgi:hypothetical protein
MSSVTEIEAAIKKLAPDDFSKIVYRIRLLQAQLNKAGKPQKKDFNGAMEKVFDHHAPLLKELAR